MIDVTDTAAAVARLRAAERELAESDRLFDDPFARHFAGGDAAAEALERFLTVPSFRDHLRLRTRFIDDVVRDAIAGGVRQIVVLGAGFDCRALRLSEIAAAAAHVFEVDLAAQLEHKRAILTAAGVALPPYLHHVASDFGDDDFAGRLRDDLVVRGLVAAHPVLVVCEGVLGYLDEPAVDRTLRWMAGCAAAPSPAVFNYSVARFDPARFGARARAAGFATVDDQPFAALHRRYLAGPPGPGGDLQRMVAART